MPRFAVILPAAGKSSRFGSAEKKPFVALDGRAVWLRSADLFARRDDVCRCIVVVAPEDAADFRRRFADDLKNLRIEVCEGGKERFESVANALKWVPRDAELVAVHDAARPCLSPPLVDEVFARAAETGAAMLALPVTDTVKRADADGLVRETVPRQGLWLAQTPQVFRRDWLTAAYAARDRLGAGITDDAQLMEAAGHKVMLVAGSAANLKITTKADLVLAQAILRTRTAPRPVADNRVLP